MENIDSIDVLIETVKYTSEIIINITEKLNNLEMKILNIEQIVNDQLKINNKNTKTIEYHEKLIKELFNKNINNSKNINNNDILNNQTTKNDKNNIYHDDDFETTNTKKSFINDTDSIIDFSIVQQKEYDKSNDKNLNNIDDNDRYKTDILVEKLLNHKKNLDNQINKEKQELLNKKIDLSGEKITRTTQESLITKRRPNAFRKM